MHHEKLETAQLRVSKLQIYANSIAEHTDIVPFHTHIQHISEEVAWTYHATKARRGVSTHSRPSEPRLLILTRFLHRLYVTFVDKENREHKIAVSKGDNLLDVAQAHDLEMEGACGGSCACSTCHVIVTDQELYDKMPEPEDDENDMLDLAFGLTETSRLGCQITMTKELDGLKVKLPSMTRNLQASDFS